MKNFIEYKKKKEGEEKKSKWLKNVQKQKCHVHRFYQDGNLQMQSVRVGHNLCMNFFFVG